MSWLKALSHSEDVFDEDGDDLSLLNKEWNSNMKKRIRDGFVDGMDAGEDASLQAGFDQGCRDGAARTVAVGRLKGIVSAISCWCQLRRPETPPPASVAELLLQVNRHEDAIMERIKAELENPLPSVSSVSDGVEDLQVETRGSGCCGGGGCPDTGCCKQGENMEVDVQQQQQQRRLRLSPGSRESGSDLVQLLQRCVDLVSELGLPQELLSHILELENLESTRSSSFDR